MKPPYFLPSVFFLFIMCLPRNSILCYASISPSMLEEFIPVSVLEAQETCPGTLKVSMMNVLIFLCNSLAISKLEGYKL